MNILKEVADAHVTAVTHRIQHAIQNSTEDVSLMLEKTSVPRPEILGITDISYDILGKL